MSDISTHEWNECNQWKQKRVKLSWTRTCSLYN